MVLVSGCTAASDGDASADAHEYYENYTPQQNDSAGGTSSSAVGGTPASGLAQPSPVGPSAPGPLEDNTFVDAGTSGFVDPREEPRSTFAVDVDGGSFRVARTLLRDGYLPPPESVRAEEWVNAFDSGFPAPGRTTWN